MLVVVVILAALTLLQAVYAVELVRLVADLHERVDALERAPRRPLGAGHELAQDGRRRGH